MMTGIHSHICPIHNLRERCEITDECKRNYVSVCSLEHPREMLEMYIKRSRQQYDEAILAMERDARHAVACAVFNARNDT